MAGDYSDDLYEGSRRRGVKPKPKVKVKSTKVGDYFSGMEETKPRPQPFSSAVEGEAQAASREAAKRQAAKTAASTAGKGLLRGAARFAGPVGAIYGAYELGSALKDTGPAKKAQRVVSDFLSRRADYKQEQADKAALEVARKRGEAKRNADKPNYMSQVSSAALKKFQDKELPEMSVTARKRAAPVADIPVKAMKSAAPKVDRMKEFMGLLDEDNAVLKRLREKGYAKGGHVKADGCARKGKTRGRII